MTIAVGTRLGGKYELIRTLGEGGMGVVWLAKHCELGSSLAVKVLRANVLADKEAVTRFDREARAAASLRGEHITRILDVGRHDDGAPYMVMEYLEGSDLGAAIAATGPQPIAFAIEVVLQACEGMAEAHARGIVHRDLKPENLFVVGSLGRPVVKILDFGISKFQADGDLRVTQTQTSFGTPLYMSPEQVRSTKNVDRRTDVWSLGVILYEAITGEPPFYGESPTAVAVAVSVEKYVPLLERRPDAPPGLEAVIAKALEKDPARRYQTVEELAAGLEPFKNAASTPGIPQPRPSASQVALSNTMRVSSVDVPALPPKRSTGALAAAGFVGVVAVGALAFALLRHGGAARDGHGVAGTSVDESGSKSNTDTPAVSPTKPADVEASDASAKPVEPTVAPSQAAVEAPAPSGSAAVKTPKPADKRPAASAGPAKSPDPAPTKPDATPTAKPKPPERNPEFL